MLATTHVLTGAVIGRRVRSPLLAFSLGALSHLCLDALPHWGIDMTSPNARGTFMKVAVVDGLTLSVVLGVMVKKRRPLSELAGALGALTLDFDKPMAELGVEQLWPDAVHRTHVGIQIFEAPQRWPVDASTALASLIYLVVSA